MKLKECLYLLGLKPRARRYGYRVDRYELPQFGGIEYAQWLHPKETRKPLRAEVIAELARFLRPGDFCIDIGAHSGDTTLPMALAVAKEGLVLALEPNPFVFPVLNKNATLNRERTNIAPLMLAATPEEGDQQFEYSDAGFCNGGRHEGQSRWRHAAAFSLTVTGVNLASLLQQRYAQWLPKLRYIKVDAEGFDFQILQSLEAVISKQRPFVQAEVFRHAPAQTRAALHVFFARHGYAVHRVLGAENLRGPKLTAPLPEGVHYDVFCVPDAGAR